MRLFPLLALMTVTASAPSLAEDWPWWSGPRADFSVHDPGLSDQWPSEGLDVLWELPLGEGYSGIAVEGGLLYTMYSEDDAEVVVAVDADSGDERWRYRYAIVPFDGMRLGYGRGPHATPTVADGRVFTVGTTSILSALEAESGRLLWAVDLWEKYGSGRLRRGYGSSPFLYRDRLMMPLGGQGGLVALDPEDGELIWRQSDLASAQSTPVAVTVDGMESLALFAKDEVVGLRPADGSILWRLPHKAVGPYNISTPVWSADGLLFVSSSYGGGAQTIRLTAADDTVQAESVWISNRLAIQFTNAVRIGDTIYGSSGRSGVITVALDAPTGELIWRTRDLGRASFLEIGGRLLALEEDGRLVLLDLAGTEPEIVAETQLVDRQTWTIPTIVGDTLYLRDREEITAFRLPIDTN